MTSVSIEVMYYGKELGKNLHRRIFELGFQRIHVIPGEFGICSSCLPHGSSKCRHKFRMKIVHGILLREEEFIGAGMWAYVGVCWEIYLKR